MGLAEPRRRIKISQDPNNLIWAQSAESYGQKVLSSQGWKPGEGLGARGAQHFNSAVPAIKVTYKDDNLGVGTTYKSASSEHARTGLDAFQGLLAKLNSKDEAEANELEQRSEDRKLALWTSGKWGGVVFVSGGLLVQGDKYRKVGDEEGLPEVSVENAVEVCNRKAARKAAKASRKTARRARQEAKLKTKAQKTVTDSMCTIGDNEVMLPTDEDTENKPRCDGHKSNPQVPVFVSTGNTLSKDQKEQEDKMVKKKNKRQPDRTDHTFGTVEIGSMAVVAGQSLPPPSDSQKVPVSTNPNHVSSRNGRHIIRGRNIEAKRMAFADAKTLDEIFMKC